MQTHVKAQTQIKKGGGAASQGQVYAFNLSEGASGAVSKGKRRKK